jgi:uncharacterized protein involved in oxidation of intracellular sulfur
MDFLLILNDPPASPGRSDNGLRVAAALLRTDDANVRVFLLGDAVSWGAATCRDAAASGPVNPLSALINAGCVVAVSEAAMRDQGIAPNDLVIGAEAAAESTLAAWCLEAERLLVF